MKSLTYISGDVTSSQDVTEALQGVDTVIHTAGVISFGTFPDYVAIEAVNVKGTFSDNCVEVKFLQFASQQCYHGGF